MKYLILSKSYPPPFTLIKAVICSLALLASGQAMAATYHYSASGATSPNLTTTLSASDWNDAACGNAGPSSGVLVTDEFEICNTATSVTYTGGTSSITGKITLNMGGNVLTLPSNLTLSANLWVFSATLDLGTTTLTMPAGSTLQNGDTITMGSGGITFGAGSTLDHYGAGFTAGTGTITFNGAGTIKSSATAALTLNHVVSTAGLTINYTNPKSVVIGGNLTIGGDVTGVNNGAVKLSDAAHTITSTVASVTIPNLDLSLVTTQTITLVPASTVGNSIAVTAYTPPASGTVTVGCTGGTLSGDITGATATLTSGSSGGSFTCMKSGGGGGAVSASINLMSNEKPVIFAEEIEMK